MLFVLIVDPNERMLCPWFQWPSVFVLLRELDCRNSNGGDGAPGRRERCCVGVPHGSDVSVKMVSSETVNNVDI